VVPHDKAVAVLVLGEGPHFLHRQVSEDVRPTPRSAQEEFQHDEVAHPDKVLLQLKEVITFSKCFEENVLLVTYAAQDLIKHDLSELDALYNLMALM
jgi:hypothetical protein